jgi:hypothetical protein
LREGLFLNAVSLCIDSIDQPIFDDFPQTNKVVLGDLRLVGLEGRWPGNVLQWFVEVIAECDGELVFF